jgi:hypothetical protein
MKINLLENQVDCVLKSLEFFCLLYPEKRQLIYSTFESIQSQKVNYISTLKRNENVTLNSQKIVDK